MKTPAMFRNCKRKQRSARHQRLKDMTDLISDDCAIDQANGSDGATSNYYVSAFLETLDARSHEHDARVSSFSAVPHTNYCDRNLDVWLIVMLSEFAISL